MIAPVKSPALLIPNRELHPRGAVRLPVHLAKHLLAAIPGFLIDVPLHLRQDVHRDRLAGHPPDSVPDRNDGAVEVCDGEPVQMEGAKCGADM